MTLGTATDRVPTAQSENLARLIATGRVPIGNEVATLFFRGHLLSIAVRCVEISRSALATGPPPSPLKPIVISRCHTYYEEWRNHRTRPTPRLD